jgi:hypothetical protein
MSEFTDGILFLNKDMEKAEQAANALSQPHLIRKLNEKWGVLLVEHFDIRKPGPANWLRKASQDFPMMYFDNAEDHGWGYNIFHEGREVASLYVNYELWWHMWLDLARKRYPNVDVMDSILHETDPAIMAIRDEVLNSRGYFLASAEQFKNLGLEQFAVFDIPTDTIARLEETLKVEHYLQFKHHGDQVEAFKRLLGIVQMTWVSYHYETKGD